MLVPWDDAVEIEPVTFTRRDSEPEQDGVFWRACRYHGDYYTCVSLERWVRVKDTPKGCWIIPDFVHQRFDDWRPHAKLILNDSNRKFAWPTKDETFADLSRRNGWWKRYLRRDLERAERTDAVLKEHGFGKTVD